MLDVQGRTYHEAKQAIADLIDASGWEDVFVLLRTLASDRHAEAIVSLFENGRLAMTVAARKQDENR